MVKLLLLYIILYKVTECIDNGKWGLTVDVFRVLDLRDSKHVTNHSLSFQMNLNDACKFKTHVRNFLEELGFLNRVSYIFDPDTVWRAIYECLLI